MPLKYQVLPAAVVVAPAMPVDSQAMQLKGWEVKLKVKAAAAKAGPVALRECVTGCASQHAQCEALIEDHFSSCQRYHAD